MALKQCENCSESADEAKAFCPACGHPFIAEEQRQQASKFDSLDNTMNMGNSMLNLVLSDMGLNTKERPGLQKQVEMLQPVAPAAPKPAQPRPPANEPPVSKKPSRNTMWYVLGGIVIAVLLLLIFLVVAFVVYQMYFR